MASTKNVLCVRSGVIICGSEQAAKIRRSGAVLAEGILYPAEREAVVFGSPEQIAMIQQFVCDEFAVY